MGKELTVYTFPVQDVAVFVNNELFKTGEHHMIPRLMKEAINRYDIESATVNNIHTEVGRANVSNTKDEFVEEYVE